MTCHNCGEEIDPIYMSCPECGYPVQDDYPMSDYPDLDACLEPDEDDLWPEEYGCPYYCEE